MLGRVSRFSTTAASTSTNHSIAANLTSSRSRHLINHVQHQQPSARSVSSFVRNALSVRRAGHNAGVHTQSPWSSAVSTSNNNNNTDVLAQVQQDVTATLNNPPPSIRSVIVRLLQNLSSKKEVDHYLKYYGGFSQDGGNNFAGQTPTRLTETEDWSYHTIECAST